MPSSETPTTENEPANSGADTKPVAGSPEPGDPRSAEQPRESDTPVVHGSRWVDYDTHELLQMIGELEDERRYARLREGIWIAVLFHLALLSALTWLPKYVFKVPAVVDKNDVLKEHKDFTYLDTPEVLKQLQQAPKVKILPPPSTAIDKKTLEAMNRATPPPAPTPAPPAPAQPQPSTQPIPPSPQPPVESPRLSAVPARPNFAMGSQNPADQLREAMKGARNQGYNGGNAPSGGGLPRHPGAGGGLEVLSDTQGVDFSAWLQRWHHETQNTWDPLIPDEVNAPINKQGIVVIRFKVLPNGRLMDNSLTLEGRSGDSALDRAAWGALTGSNYPPLPRDFHGPYLELRASFWYNVEPPR